MSEHLIRVFTIPAPDGEWVFEPQPREFVEVDWFKDSLDIPADLWEMMDAGPEGATREDRSITTEKGRAALEQFIREKHYFVPGKAYLVVSPRAAFTIDYTGDLEQPFPGSP